MIFFLLAVALSALLTGLTIPLAKHFGLVTRDDRNHPAHTHTGIIPRAGGLPIFIAIALLCFLFMPMNKLLISVLIASALLVVTGIVDDRYDISPYVRFGVNFIAALIVVAGGLGIPYISSPLGGVIWLNNPQIAFDLFGTHTIWVIADALAIVWLISLMNIVNWSKGVDGQLPGYVMIAAIFMGIIAMRVAGHTLTAEYSQMFAFIIAGAFGGFLIWNFYPQQIMPGYGGGALAGFLLGVLAILSFGKVGTLALVLAVPLLDGVYTVMRRVAQGRSPFWGDAGHLHHLLLRQGWGRRRIAVFYMGITALFGMVALYLPNTLSKFMVMAAIIAGFSVWIYTLTKKK